MNITFTTW